MSNGNGRASAPSFGPERFAETVTQWLEQHRGLVLGLIDLRELDMEAEQAVEEVMEIPTVRRMRLGWELWEAMAEGEGFDPEALIYDHLSIEVIDLIRAAFWDVPLPERQLTLVDSLEVPF